MIRTLYRALGAAIDAAIPAAGAERAQLAHQAYSGRMECDGPDATDLLNEIEAEREVFEPLDLIDIDFPNRPAAGSPPTAVGSPAGAGTNPPAGASGPLNGGEHALCVLCLGPRGCGCFPIRLL